MYQKRDGAHPARRFVAACAAALLVLLALTPGVVLAGDQRPAGDSTSPARPAASALAGLDGLWGALTGAWDDLTRRFAADSAGGSSDDSSTTDGGPACRPDCEGDPSIDPNG